MKTKLFFMVLLASACWSLAIAAPAPTGLWLTRESADEPGGFMIRISLLSGQLVGRIEQVNDPAKRAARCLECPGSRKGQLLLGMTVLMRARFDKGEDAWIDGIFVDPEDGSLNNASITVLPDGQKLELKTSGVIFYRKSTWTRIE